MTETNLPQQNSENTVIPPNNKGKKYNKKPSIRQRKAIANLLKNDGKQKSAYQALIEAGYSEAYAKNARNFLDGKAVQQEVSPVLNKMLSIRERVYNSMAGKDFNKESARTLMAIAKELTHDIRLLSGEKTEDFGIGELTKDLSELINEVKNAK